MPGFNPLEVIAEDEERSERLREAVVRATHMRPDGGPETLKESRRKRRRRHRAQAQSARRGLRQRQ